MTDADKPTSELLPCPFCGKRPAAGWIRGSAPGMDDFGYYGIDCCRAHAHEDSEEEAVAAWNRRTPAPPDQREEGQDEIARLRAALNWYARSPDPGEFRIVDKDGEFVSDMADWGDRARAALAPPPDPPPAEVDPEQVEQLLAEGREYGREMVAGCDAIYRPAPSPPLDGPMFPERNADAALAAAKVECTGVGASWCPIHGDCSCPEDPTGLDDRDDPRCPLHSPNSPHGEDDLTAPPPSEASGRIGQLTGRIGDLNISEQRELAVRVLNVMMQRDSLQAEVDRLRGELAERSTDLTSARRQLGEAKEALQDVVARCESNRRWDGRDYKWANQRVGEIHEIATNALHRLATKETT